MKNLIIYLGITLIALSSVSFASTTSKIGEQKMLNRVYKASETLPIAISKGEIDIVKNYIENGTNVNKKFNGMTSLMYAARYNKVEIIKYLLEKGAKRDIKDNQGFTALKHAELSSAFDAIALLKATDVNDNRTVNSSTTSSVKFAMVYDAALMIPDTVSFAKPAKTIERIIADNDKIIENTDFDEIQPLDFARINKNVVNTNKINPKG